MSGAISPRWMRADPGRRGGQAAGVALLSAVSSCFALGEATLEQFKHLAAADAGPLAGLGALPDLRTIRPELAALADRTDPVAVQRLFASAMLAADPVLSGVYYVDDHFVPYAGAKPVAKGWNNKRGNAERGRADTLLAVHDGRAVCFVAGEPSGLAATFPKALAKVTKAAGPGAQIMVGFDQGGAYAQVFRHCRDQQAHWVIYRRAPLAVPAMLPVNHHDHPRRQGPAGHLGRGDHGHQGLRAGPADHAVRARHGRAADPDVRS